MPKDIIDITVSPIKTINNLKGNIHCTSNLKKQTLINDGKLSKQPLQEIEENMLKSTNESTKEKIPRKRRKKRKGKNTASATQSTFKFYDTENYQTDDLNSPSSVKELENKVGNL